jgi:hypothetical protein
VRGGICHRRSGWEFQTAHRRFGQWIKAGLWRRVHHAILDELGSRACSTGAARSWTARVYGRKKGIHDRSQPGGSRRRKPAKPHADKAYDQTDLRRWVRNRGIKVRIARKVIESSQKLGKHRWVIKRTL